MRPSKPYDTLALPPEVQDDLARLEKENAELRTANRALTVENAAAVDLIDDLRPHVRGKAMGILSAATVLPDGVEKGVGVLDQGIEKVFLAFDQSEDCRTLISILKAGELITIRDLVTSNLEINNGSYQSLGMKWNMGKERQKLMDRMLNRLGLHVMMSEKDLQKWISEPALSK